jgi:chromosome segregation ATPase
LIFRETLNRDEQVHQLQIELQMIKEETVNERNQTFHSNQRLQLLELELEQKNLMLSSWAKDKAELEEKRLVISHHEAERMQYQGQIQKMREDFHVTKKKEQMLEEKVKEINKYDDERKQLQQLKIELDVKKKIGMELENENKLLLDRIRYLESQISILNKQLANFGMRSDSSAEQSEDSLVSLRFLFYVNILVQH